jgi:hypothetical protein
MQKLITTKKLIPAVTLLVLLGAPAAIAQTGGGGSRTGGASTAGTSSGAVIEAPIGHRQPRADQVPSEKNLSNPNDPMNKEDAALDRKIKSICRGC